MRRISALAVALFAAGLLGSARADTYAFDDAHAAVTFRIEHLGISWTYGRFNVLEGKFVHDKAAPEKTEFDLKVKVDSIDTNNGKRDEHLKSPDFFDAKQFPMITFKSKSVKPVKEGYEVSGDFTMHGVTKPLTFVLKGGKEAEFPKGVQRIGFSTELTLKRSEFGMDKLAPAIGDEVFINISFEGVKR